MVKFNRHTIIFAFSLIVFSYQVNAQQCADFEDVELGPDTTLCAGSTLQLDLSALTGYASLVWENNTTTPTRTINASGSYSVEVKYIGENLIVNGDFQQGDTGFYTEYMLGTGGSWGQLSNPETYAINTSPSNVHNNFSYCSDHTGNNGNMMIVNGSGTPGKKVWCQNIDVNPDTDYEFSTWVTNALYDPNVADLQFTINDIPLGGIFSPSSYGCDWSQFFENWNSGIETNIDVCITNLNIDDSGNDFALDDIYFAPICVFKDTIEVSYLSDPTFTLPTIYNDCEGEDIVLNAENTGLDYDWSTGENTQNITVNESGTYSVEVSHNGKCAKTQDFDVTLHEAPDAGNDFSMDFCNTENTVDLFTLIDPSIAQTGTWENEANETVPNGVINISNSNGSEQYKYILPAQYCPADTALYTVNIKEFKSAGVDATAHLCNDGQINLNDFVNNGTPGGHWNSLNGLNGNRLNETTGIFDVANLDKNDYVAEYIIDNELPCAADKALITINLSEYADVKFSSNSIDGCAPLPVEFYNQTEVNGTVDYAWFVNDEIVSDENNFDQTFDTPICYDIKLRVTTDNLCVAEKEKPNFICVFPDPVAKFDFYPAEVYSDDPTVHFENESQLNSQNLWTFEDIETSNEADPIYTFPLGEEQDYKVTLKVTSVNGCIDSITELVPVKHNTIYYIPNAFTPDANEYNNVFQPIMSFGIDPDYYEFYIFNRWGELLFKTFDLQEGWDGSFNGRPAPSGVYVWKLIFKESSTDNSVNKTGTVTLIK